MYKIFENFFLIMLSLLTVSIYSPVSYSAQDPTRPPSWMAESANVETRKEVLILQQILISKNRKIAVINDKVVSEGDMVKGAKVREINRDWVSIIRSGRRVTLKLVPTTKEYINE
ncbi:MAG: hypothetical protein V7765_07920 [Oleispira sp.]